jgi:hypothetical protein
MRENANGERQVVQRVATLGGIVSNNSATSVVVPEQPDMGTRKLVQPVYAQTVYQDVGKAGAGA